MSLLVLLLPPRRRLGVRTAGEPAAALLPAELEFVFSPDGQAVGQSGHAAPALLPKADRTLLVLTDADVAWQRVDLPKAAPARMRAALVGAMEEQLLDDEEALHFALGPGAEPGRSGWVAVLHKGWVAGAVAALEGAGREVAGVVVASHPREVPIAHFHTPEAGGPVQLVLERADGVACTGLEGTLARSLLAAGEGAPRCTATPAAAVEAERFVGAPVAVLGTAERALAACREGLDLRQFDLAPRHRGLRALREGWRGFLAPAWRPVRFALLALVAVQLVALNAYAWRQERTLAGKRQAMEQLLRATFPGVRSVLDAPLQMQRETDRARTAAGRLGESDLETLLGAAAAAWPDGAGPAATLRFEGGRLTLPAAGWAEAQVLQFRERLRGAGYAAEFAEGRVTLAPLRSR